MQRQFINFIRIAIFIVMVWIGGLKVCQYEADGIAHFVSNSPLFRFSLLLVTLTQSILAIKKSNSSVMNFLNISGSLMMLLVR